MKLTPNTYLIYNATEHKYLMDWDGETPIIFKTLENAKNHMESIRGNYCFHYVSSDLVIRPYSQVKNLAKKAVNNANAKLKKLDSLCHEYSFGIDKGHIVLIIDSEYISNRNQLS